MDFGLIVRPRAMLKRHQGHMNSTRKKYMNSKLQIPNVADAIEGKRTVESLESLIRKHPFFNDLSPHQYRLLADSAMRTHFHPGEVIFRQGDPANRFYLIQHGQVSVEAWLRERGTITIQTLGAGKFWAGPGCFRHTIGSLARARWKQRTRFLYMEHRCARSVNRITNWVTSS
jgi:CRP/FNR family cyclic AMP-dependent transcriptional regulator